MNPNTPKQSTRIPDNIIQQIRDIEIVDAMAPYLNFMKKGSVDIALCPFHTDTKPSLQIHTSQNKFKCFSCNKRGDAIDVVMKVKGVEFPEAVRMIAADHKIEIPKEELTAEQETEYKKRDAIYTVNKWAAKWFSSQLMHVDHDKAMQYVKGRWNDKTVDDFNIGYAPDKKLIFINAATEEGYTQELLMEAGLIAKNKKEGNDPTYVCFRDRIMIPIINRNGYVCGFTGRLLSPKKDKDGNDIAKYVNTGENAVYHKKQILFGLYAAKRTIKEEKNVYLVEGNADMIKLYQIGVYNCVATSGTALSKEQIDELKKITPCITLIPDMDLPKTDGSVPAGQASAARSAKLIIENGLFCKIILLPEGKEKQDPDSFFKNKDQFDKFEKDHRKDYIIQLAESKKDSHKENDQKALLRQEIISLVLHLPENTHDDYFDELGVIIPPKISWKGKTIKSAIKKIDLKQNNEQKNSLRGGSKNERIEIYLTEKYIFRYNTIKCKAEYRKEKNEDWIPMDKVKLNSLKRELNCVDICSSTDNIKSILESDFSPSINPIKEYFKGLPEWDKVDHLSTLCKTISTKNDDLFYKYFRKWIIGVIANALEDDSCKNHLCLVITGKQGKFKTSWLENLCPTALRTHYLYTGKIQPQNKDVLTYLAEYLFINIDDQLRQLNKIDENELKNLITINYVKYRRPYDPFITEYPHLASFMASVNGNDFLTDISGSRRFLPFEALDIKIDDAQNINMDFVYSQAYNLYKQGERYWFNDEEITELHDYNEGFRIVSNEEELVLHYYNIPESRMDATHFFNTTLIKAKIEQLSQQRLSSKKVGEALTKLNFEKWQRRLENNTREWVWSVIEKTGSSISGENRSDMPF